MQTQSIKPFLSDITKQIILSPSDTLDRILPKFFSSHEIAYVYEKHKLLGIVWLHYLLYHSIRPDRYSKIKSYIYTGSKLTPDSNIQEAFSQMLSLRLYTLPVFDQNNLLIKEITADNLIMHFLKNKDLKQKIADFFQIQTPLLVKKNQKLKQIYRQMISNKQTRPVLIDEHGSAEGIISRRDIFNTVLNRTKNKSSSGIGRGERSTFFDERMMDELNIPADKSITKTIVYAEENIDIALAYQIMLEKKIGSVLIIDGKNQPAGMISKRSYLKAILAMMNEHKLNIIISDKNEKLTAFRRMEANDLLQKFALICSKHALLERINCTIETVVKTGDRSAERYSLSVQIFFQDGRKFYAKSESHDLRSGIQDAQTKILHQIQN